MNSDLENNKAVPAAPGEAPESAETEEMKAAVPEDLSAQDTAGNGEDGEAQREPKSFETRLRRARRRRRRTREKVFYGALAALLFVLILVTAADIQKNRDRTAQAAAESLSAAAEEAHGGAGTDSAVRIPETESEEERILREVLSEYKNLGIIKVEGYVNMRKDTDPWSDVIGKLYGGCACEILDVAENGRIHVESGGIEGYVHPDYVLTGDAAMEAVPEQIRERAIITADKLNIRTEPDTSADIAGSALKNERYQIYEKKDGWLRVYEGWISADYAEVRECLNEARKLDLRAMVLSMYDNLGISEVTGYLNIRKEAGEDKEIIGKLTSKAGCDILAEENGWYKIRSGDITGYVKSDFIATGDKAREDALENAQLMAIVTTDILNARTEPSDSGRIWTQITNEERYPVVRQMDGWVEIELEENDNAFVKTDFVDVRYALNEAIHFSPAEEARMASESRRQQIVNYALQFLGNPYVWGGTSLTRGCDCSGFTMKVMEHFGVSLPHYSGSQAKMGVKVTSETMRPGDLVFYSNSGGTVNHVGIYIGNGQIVNAASRRSGIKISRWNYRRPTAIRNVLGD